MGRFSLRCQKLRSEAERGLGPWEKRGPLFVGGQEGKTEISSEGRWEEGEESGNGGGTLNSPTLSTGCLDFMTALGGD